MTNKLQHRELVRVVIFGVLSVVFAFLYVFGLVNNSNGAVERYNTLIAVDKAGGDVEAALNDLRRYIYRHMNTEIGGQNSIYPPIQLSGTYDRLIAEEESRVAKANDNLYSEAQSHCEKTGSQGYSGSNRLDCINQYIDTNGAKASAIDDSLYKYDFVAPRWSPDLAGISFVSLILSSLVTVFNLLMYFRTKHMVHIGN